MLKTVSSIVNAIGALNYKGTWNASTNTPALASGVGTKGDYYVVSVAGSTALDGISNWGIGDWAAYNGTTWQRVEGGADLNGVNLSVSGTTTLSALTASTALALDASKNVVSVTNTGTGDNVLATAPTLVGDVTLSTGNLVIGASNKGISYPASVGGSALAPAVSVYASASQTLTNSTIAKITLDTELFDTNSNFDPTTNYRFTPTVAGYYQVNASIGTGSAVTGVTLCLLLKNGGSIVDGNLGTNSTSNASSILSSIIFMNGTTDFLEIYGVQNSGGNLATIAGQNKTYFNACLIRGT